jgi:hypothetical protein
VRANVPFREQVVMTEPPDDLLIMRVGFERSGAEDATAVETETDRSAKRANVLMVAVDDQGDDDDDWTEKGKERKGVKERIVPGLRERTRCGKFVEERNRREMWPGGWSGSG